MIAWNSFRSLNSFIDIPCFHVYTNQLCDLCFEILQILFKFLILQTIFLAEWTHQDTVEIVHYLLKQKGKNKINFYPLRLKLGSSMSDAEKFSVRIRNVRVWTYGNEMTTLLLLEQCFSTGVQRHKTVPYISSSCAANLFLMVNFT